MAISCFVVYSTLLWIGRSTSKSMYNPMITICTTISGHTHLVESMYMIGSQILGGLLASTMVFITVPRQQLNEITDNNVLGVPISDNYDYTH